MNFIDELLRRLDTMSSDDIIQEIGGNIYKAAIDREEIFQYPQFIQDIIFLIDMDTELNMQGDIFGNSTEEYIPNMITALRNIHADNEADILQNIHNIYKSTKDSDDDDTIDEIIDDLYDKMYFHTKFDIWSLLDTYTKYEKNKNMQNRAVMF